MTYRDINTAEIYLLKEQSDQSSNKENVTKNPSHPKHHFFFKNICSILSNLNVAFMNLGN